MIKMIAIPGGTFMMGSPEDDKYPITEGSKNSERPQHQVTVKPFSMGKYPITQAQWRAIAKLPQVNKELEPNPSYFKGDDLPVESVSWNDAQEFCARLSRMTNKIYRLPTEAQWEYACRAGTTTPFYFGNRITTKLANYNSNGTKEQYREKTTDVGSFPPNAFGLYDMPGNVWEWCEDGWHNNYEGAPIDGTAWKSVSIYIELKVIRGGAWYRYSEDCRSASRNSVADFDNRYVGFRVVCST
ncbi:MAG: formylglycine-generating enzyme family protein [Microcystis panniformis]